MPGGFPLSRELCNGNSVGVVYGIANYGTAVVSNGSQNVMGSWTQITASTPSDTCWMYIQMNGGNAYNDFVINVGVGGAGSEVIIAKSICFPGEINNTATPVIVEVPCSIPAGSRIAVQLQVGTKGTAPMTAYISLQLFDDSFAGGEGFSGTEAIGFTLATTQPTIVPGSTTIDVKGPWTQLVASTPRDYAGFSMSTTEHGNTGFVEALDIAIGAGGSEQIIVADALYVVSSYALTFPTQVFWIPIPAGTRIAARTTNHITTTTGAGQFPLSLNGIF